MAILEDEFGDIVRKAREGRGLSHADLARASGVPAARLVELERLAGPPTREEAESLGRALGLGADALWRIAAGEYDPGGVEIPAGLAILRFVFPGANSNGYLIHFDRERATLLVDPGGDPAPVLAALRERDWRLDAVLITHGHGDHVAGVGEVRAATGAPVYADAREWQGPGLVDIGTLDGFAVGAVRVGVIPAPGHTPHHVAFTLAGGQVAAVGDTLFAGSLGRALGGPRYYDRLLDSARRLLALGPTTLLLPGHGPLTTVASERAGNPFAAGLTAS